MLKQFHHTIRKSYHQKIIPSDNYTIR